MYTNGGTTDLQANSMLPQATGYPTSPASGFQTTAGGTLQPSVGFTQVFPSGDPFAPAFGAAPQTPGFVQSNPNSFLQYSGSPWATPYSQQTSPIQPPVYTNQMYPGYYGGYGVPGQVVLVQQPIYYPVGPALPGQPQYCCQCPPPEPPPPLYPPQQEGGQDLATMLKPLFTLLLLLKLLPQLTGGNNRG